MTAVRSATAAVVGWLARASPSPSPLRSPSGASSDAHLACCIEAACGDATSMQQSRMSDTPCSLARLHSTLRYLNALGGKALVDGSAIGSLEHLEHPHAPFTSMRGVQWIRRCHLLKVLDLANSPCCVRGGQGDSGGGAAAVLAGAGAPEQQTSG